MQNSSLECKFSEKCGGCNHFGDFAHTEEEQIKSLWNSHFQIPLNEIIHGSRIGFRNKADMTIVDGEVLGFYQKGSKNILSISECQLLVPELNELIRDFAKSLAPIQKGSIRFRTSPSGKRGIWLDFANTDVKKLMDSGYLLRLSELAEIEIGQRQKPLIIEDENPKLLKKVRLGGWLNTFVGDELNPHPLQTPISGFTQPSNEYNKILIGAVKKIVDEIESDNFLDLFCGRGNFTLPLLSWQKNVTAIELNKIALIGLEASVEDLQLQSSLEIQKLDLQNNSAWEPSSGAKAIIVDPPRSGLGRLSNRLAEWGQVKDIIYVSCFLDSLANDFRGLTEHFDIKYSTAVNQFPHSQHSEWIVHLKRKA